MTIYIRNLKWSDYNSCKKLFHNVFDLSEDNYLFQAWRNRCELASFVAVIYDIVIGFILVDNTLCIQYIAVHELYRNNKIGSTLLKNTCGVLHDKSNVRLETSNDKRLKQWYEKFGFIEKESYIDGKYIGSFMIKNNNI